ncbi:hypothetical protein SXCC_03008 [Gluconacetobacter sp. SXCC-1]|nr:hypothetical protein SXCC_03008 [Gluconacetobacter sp. SXCC-1]
MRQDVRGQTAPSRTEIYDDPVQHMPGIPHKAANSRSEINGWNNQLLIDLP